MKAFTELYLQLDSLTDHTDKVDVLKSYLSSASPDEASWAAFLLSGRRISYSIKSSQLRSWVQDWSAISDWLFDECYGSVGDVVETISLLMPSVSAERNVSISTAPAGTLDSQNATLTEVANHESSGQYANGHSTASAATSTSPGELGPSILHNPSGGGVTPSEVGVTTSGVGATRSALCPRFAALSVGPHRCSLCVTLERLDDPMLIESLNCVMTAWKSVASIADPLVQREYYLQTCLRLNDPERLIFNKIITGTFRPPISLQGLVTAISALSSVATITIAQRLSSNWEPSADAYVNHCNPQITRGECERSYSFQFAKSLVDPEQLETLGESSDWHAEWKWDGIRAHLIKKDGSVILWSHEGELLTDRFPELAKESAGIADGVVLDGEIIAWKDADVLPYQMLQQRLSRKTPSAKLLSEIPAVFLAYDLLEENGIDIRQQAIEYRQEQLAGVLSKRSQISSGEFEQLRLFAPCQIQLSPSLRVSPILALPNWETLHSLRSDARKMKVMGVVLKRRGSIYCEDSRSADWLEWKLDPLTVDAVLVAAQQIESKHGALFTDLTLAIWHNNELLTFAKAVATDDAITVDAFVRENTIARFGPMRTVKAELVFELAFEGVQVSQRYKAGHTVRGARILRWRREKTAKEAGTLAAILASYSIP